jgi:putative DNA primase/helicase
MNLDNIPHELKDRPQWVAWILVERAGKKTKLPVNPKTGKSAKTDDPTTWGTFEQAVRAGKQLNGIGYVFSADDPYCGIDLDGHIDHELIGWFASYAERSQSGTGAHIIVRATLGDGRKTDRYEAYDRLRYFVMTGDLLHAGPIAESQDKLDQFIATVFPVEPAGGTVDLSAFFSRKSATPDTLERIRASAQAAKFESLWAGNWSGYESQSQADAALLSILRFWTGGDKDEAFRLFAASGLCRDKWTKRSDYRERTWKAIDSGAVYEAPEPVISPRIVTRNVSPWRAVTVDRALEAIQGSVLEPLVAAMRSPMEPLLPPEVGLVKALVLCGCALSEKRTTPREGGNLAIHTLRGADLARVRILTAGGSVPNVMAMIVAESAIGKDVGGLLQRVAHHYGWMIGTAGSEEGIADAYISKPNGVMQISEMVNWLDKRHWQSKAASFLTGAFNAGWFSHALSKRSDGPSRETNYCFPNIYAAVQPGALQTYASKVDLDNGFLGRFLIAEMPAGYFGCPVIGDLATETAACIAALDALRLKDCDIRPPSCYNHALGMMFTDHKAEPGPTWRRLISEYYPRFAAILSVRPGDSSPQIELTPEAWQRAAVLVQYFFAQAEAVLTNIHDDQTVNRFEGLCRRILTIIDNNGDKCPLSTISRMCGAGTRAKERHEALNELVTRGVITTAKVQGVTMFARA